MARKVFFSFHYERDNWRVNQVRNSWVTKPDRDSAGFWDSAEWEEVQKKGDVAVKRWIDKQMEGTSVTVVLIGAETANRKYVRYEIQKSYEKGKGIIGIRIHQNKDQNGNADKKGDTDFGKIDGEHEFSELYPVYDWVDDNGYENMGEWIERAVLIANRPELLPPSQRSMQPSNCIR